MRSIEEFLSGRRRKENQHNNKIAGRIPKVVFVSEKRIRVRVIVRHVSGECGAPHGSFPSCGPFACLVAVVVGSCCRHIGDSHVCLVTSSI